MKSSKLVAFLINYHEVSINCYHSPQVSRKGWCEPRTYKVENPWLKLCKIWKAFNFLGLNENTDISSILFLWSHTYVKVHDLKVFICAIIIKFVLYSMKNILGMRLGNMECKWFLWISDTFYFQSLLPIL